VYLMSVCLMSSVRYVCKSLYVSVYVCTFSVCVCLVCATHFFLKKKACAL